MKALERRGDPKMQDRSFLRTHAAPALLGLSVMSGVVVALPVTAEAKPSPAAVGSPPLVELLTCQAGWETWFKMGEGLMSAETRKAWGWKEAKWGGGLLQAYDLPRPIKLYGEPVARIAFSGSSIVAVLSKTPLEKLVEDLALEPVSTGLFAKIYGKTVQSETAGEGDGKVRKTASLSVSTSSSYPGVVLAGCSYAVAVGS